MRNEDEQKTKVSLRLHLDLPCPERPSGNRIWARSLQFSVMLGTLPHRLRHISAKLNPRCNNFHTHPTHTVSSIQWQWLSTPTEPKFRLQMPLTHRRTTPRHQLLRTSTRHFNWSNPHLNTRTGKLSISPRYRPTPKTKILPMKGTLFRCQTGQRPDT